MRHKYIESFFPDCVIFGEGIQLYKRTFPHGFNGKELTRICKDCNKRIVENYPQHNNDPPFKAIDVVDISRATSESYLTDIKRKEAEKIIKDYDTAIQIMVSLTEKLEELGYDETYELMKAIIEND